MLINDADSYGIKLYLPEATLSKLRRAPTLMHAQDDSVLEIIVGGWWESCHTVWSGIMPDQESGGQ